MTPEDIDPILAVALGAQLVFLLVGVFLFWRVMFSERGRAARECPSPLPPWMITGTDFAYAVLIVIGIGVGGNIIASYAAKWLGLSSEMALVLMGGGFQGGLLAGGLIAATFVRQKQIADGIKQPATLAPPLNPWLAGAVALLAAFPVLTAINLGWTATLNAFGLDTSQQELVEIFGTMESPVAIAAMCLLAVVVAPLTEEVIFRAGLFRYLRTRAPRWVALGLPAAIFAVMHGNLVAFGPLLALGVVFALAYERTGRIAVPIVAHGLFNLNTIVLLLAGVEV